MPCLRALACAALLAPARAARTWLEMDLSSANSTAAWDCEDWCESDVATSGTNRHCFSDLRNSCGGCGYCAGHEADAASLECAVGMELPKVGPREPWILPERLQAQCYESAMHHFNWSSEFKMARQARSTGRNWCWAILKEFGCHWSLWDPKRKHLTWEEMSDKAEVATVEELSRKHQAPLTGRDTGTNGSLASWDKAMTLVSSDVVRMLKPLLNDGTCDRRELGAVRVWTAEEWNAAAVWFRKHVTVYAVNLEASAERWTAFLEEMDRLSIKARRVSGVDMREKDALQKAKDEGIVPHGYNFTRAQAEAESRYQAMGRVLGTIGCASAHFRAQTTAREEAKTPLALVLEDDAIPAEDLVPKLWSLVHAELPCDWQVVSLRSMCPFGRCVSPHLTRVQPDVNEPEDRCRHGVNYGMQGVLYRVAEIPKIQGRWRSVVFNETRPHCLDIDVALASISDTVGFYAVPFVQYPGFLTERHGSSSRYNINEGRATL